MKIFLRIIGGLLYFVLLLLRPILMIISTISSGIFTFVGGFIVVVTLLMKVSGEELLLSQTIFLLVCGSVLTLAGPFIVSLEAGYEILHEKLGDFVFNRVRSEDDFDDFLM